MTFLSELNLDLFGRVYRLVFTPEELAAVLRPIAPGDWGGHQHLEALVQARTRDGVCALSDAELQRAYHYAYAYGSGTWQTYMRAVVAAASRAGWPGPTEGAPPIAVEAPAPVLPDPGPALDRDARTAKALTDRDDRWAASEARFQKGWL